jgi:ferrous iron transport protein B
MKNQVDNRIEKDESNNREILETANSMRWELGENLHDSLLESIYQDAAKISEKVVTKADEKPRYDWDRTLDRLLTSKWTGFPIMLFMLTVVFWITISAANVPSALLANLLIDSLHPLLKDVAAYFGTPFWLDGLLIDGIYLAMAWVISVMLPPMAIFFPLFTLLEDFGYLPRVAFNLDGMFKKAGAHGKQALTMAMGYGCNAAGIIATRVIDSPRIIFHSVMGAGQHRY